MFVCDQITYKILDVNDVAIRKFGWDKSRFLEYSLNEIGVVIPSNRREELFDSDLLELSGEIWKISINQKESYVQFSSHLINFDGKPAKLVVAHDITGLRKKNSQKMPVSTPVGLHNFPLAEIEWDKNDNVLRWSDKAEEIFGFSQREAISNDDLIYEIIHPDDLNYVIHEKERNVNSKSPMGLVVNRNLTKSGEVIYCEWYNSFLFDSDGELVSTYSLVSEVTSRVKIMEEHQKSMKSYRDLFNSISDAIYLVNDEGVILTANQGVKDTFGYEPKDLIEKNQQFLRAPGKFDSGFMFHLKEKELGRNQVKTEAWGKRANGEVFQTEMLINRANYFGEDVWIFNERDISERKDAEDELKKRELLFSELFETSPLGIVLLSSHNEVMQVNQGFTNMFGYENYEIKGLEIDRIIIPENEFEYATSLTNTDRVEEEECRRITKNGDKLDVLIYAVPIRIDKKTIAKYGIYVDITERKRYEKELMGSLKEKEVLLAEIHHRVKNNLAVITGLLELQSYNTDNFEAQDVLVESRLRVNSIALVHETLYQNENLSEINIESYLHKLSKILNKSIGRNSHPVTIHYDLDDVPLAVTQAIPCGLLLNEILTNCYKHAFEGRDSGDVWISFKRENDFLHFTIRDNGIGLPEEDMVKESNSLGMKLIKTLSKQLNAETNFHNDNGAVFDFKFLKG